jgi:crotonobetainyl-CoA:carnitine CoA-transferase CaiB-like acyl-CoA transferase
MKLFGPAGVPCAEVNDVAQAFDDEHATARQMIAETAHPRWGTVRAPASPVKVGSTSPDHRRAPTLGEDGVDLLTTVLGYDAATIDRLRADRAFGDAQGPA